MKLTVAGACDLPRSHGAFCGAPGHVDFHLVQHGGHQPCVGTGCCRAVGVTGKLNSIALHFNEM